MDRELDEALRTYSSATPPAGMEERILRRARGSRRPYWALPVAAGLLLGFVFWPVAEEAPVKVVSPTVVETAQVEQPKVAVRAVLRRQARKPVQFPAPSPLTEEERALLGLFRRAPEVAASLNAEAAPLKIDELQIELLSDGN